MQKQIGRSVMRYKFLPTNYCFESVDNGSFHKEISNKTDSYSKEWDEKQKASIKEYQVDHEGGYKDETRILLTYFKFFISYHINEIYLEKKDKVNILDIGCGVGIKKPIYVPNNDTVNYVGLDPFGSSNPKDYCFINSTIENLNHLLDSFEFDIIIFCTSLDHIQDLVLMRKSIHDYCHNKSRILTLSGMHDPQLTFNIQSSQVLEDISNFLISNKLRERILFLKALVKAFLKIYYNVYESLIHRQGMLKNNVNLDNKHFHYFTSDVYEFILNKTFGKKIDLIRFGKSNCYFAANTFKKFN